MGFNWQDILDPAHVGGNLKGFELSKFVKDMSGGATNPDSLNIIPGTDNKSPYAGLSHLAMDGGWGARYALANPDEKVPFTDKVSTKEANIAAMATIAAIFGGAALASWKAAAAAPEGIPVAESTVTATAIPETVPMGSSSMAGQSSPIGGEVSWLERANQLRRLMPNQRGGGTDGNGGGQFMPPPPRHDIAKRMGELMGLSGTNEKQNEPYNPYAANTGLDDFYQRRFYGQR